MKKLGFVLCSMLLLVCAAPTASAATITLFDFGFNVDGDIFAMSFPATSDKSGFDETTGLGTVILTVTGVGAHNVIGFFDHEIDEDINTFFNEYGIGGTPAAGQSWEIDEPGWVYGDIYDNFLAGALDNSNGVPDTAPDDVSMAMGWNFFLNAGETANIIFNISTTQPRPFFLTQVDPDSQVSIFLSSRTVVTGGGGQPGVPEPSTVVLLISGLGLLAAARFRKSS